MGFESRSTRSSNKKKAAVLGAVPLRLAVMKEDDDSTDQDIDPADFKEDGVMDDFESLFTFKVKDANGNLHKINSPAEHFDKLVKAVRERLKCDESQVLELRYNDSDGDELIISDDQSLNEAVDNARASDNDMLRVIANVAASPNTTGKATSGSAFGVTGQGALQGVDPTIMAVAAGSGALVLIIATVYLMRRK